MQGGGQPFGERFSKLGGQPQVLPESFCSRGRAGCGSDAAVVIWRRAVHSSSCTAAAGAHRRSQTVSGFSLAAFGAEARFLIHTEIRLTNTISLFNSI